MNPPLDPRPEPPPIGEVIQIGATKAPGRFKLTPFDQVRMPKSGLYLVKGLVPREGLVIVWGPPKCGKTFVVLDMAMHIALGWPYRGRRTIQGAVVYVALEGELGISARIEAFRRQHLSDQSDPVPFYLLVTRLDLAVDRAELIADIRAQLGEDGCAAIVIDTLNRSLAGSESSDQDMSAYIKGADAVRAAFNCAMIIIHHCGHDTTRARGHTSLLGAADAQMAVRREADGRVAVLLEYMKDGPSGAVLASTLKVVELDLDEDKEPITSCVVEPADATPMSRRRPPLHGAKKVAYDFLCKAIDEHGAIPPANTNIPANWRAVQVAQWRKVFYAGTSSEDGTAEASQEAKKKAFSRAVRDLQAADFIRTHEDWVWSTSRGAKLVGGQGDNETPN